MTKSARILLASCLFTIQLAACSPKPDPEAKIKQSVAATVAAIPTYTPYPIPTAYPTSTPMSLSGLFCEYQFCIGHPTDMAFFDVSAQNNPQAPSGYTQGLLAAYNASLFIELLWQQAPNTADPKFLLDLILEDEVDEMVGDMNVMLIRDMNVLFTPITTTISETLPFGGAAAWTCGDRVFAWKSYTSQHGQAAGLFEEAIQKFRCND